MRISAAEKQEVINLVDRSELGVNKTLQQLGIAKSTFYIWYKAYLEKGSEGLAAQKKTRRQWNSIPEEQKQLVVEVALDHPELSPRELACRLTDEQEVFICEKCHDPVTCKVCFNSREGAIRYAQNLFPLSIPLIKKGIMASITCHGFVLTSKDFQ